jgi:hypothetical protein
MVILNYENNLVLQIQIKNIDFQCFQLLSTSGIRNYKLKVDLEPIISSIMGCFINSY